VMWSNFETTVGGKWVLTGEHSVLRMAEAIALPHPEVFLKLRFQPFLNSPPEGSAGDFSVEPLIAEPLILKMLTSIEGFKLPSGKLRIESTIPIGAGLGSSAALCVALTRWLTRPLQLPLSQVLGFATRLEHLFHGKSSGMDVAVVSVGAPIAFTSKEGPTPLPIKKLPRFTLHDTGLRCKTSLCIEKVDLFRTQFLEKGRQVDHEMKAASELAKTGLIHYHLENRKQGLSLLTKAMEKGRSCFYAWDLVPPEVQKLEDQLLNEGALAVKLTGAGAGGMVVALWS